MLKLAEARKIYDQLIEGDITSILSSSAESYDMILAGDVLVYIGDLSQVMSAAANSLRKGGAFAFTIENHAGEGFLLHGDSRFSHSIQYIRDLATANGLRESSITPATIRINYGKGVSGSIIVFERPE